MRSTALSLLLAAVAGFSSPALAQPATPTEPLPSLPASSPAAPAPAPAPAVAPMPPPAPVPAPPAEPLLEPPPPRRLHDGFYLRYSGGIGYMSASGDGPLGSASVSGLASTFHLAIGGSLAQGLALAGTIGGETTTNTFNGGPFNQAMLVRSGGNPIFATTHATAALAQLGLIADWYPDPAGSWHAGALAALGLVGVTNQADDSSLGGVAVSGGIFGGYDWWVGRSWSFGLMLVASGASRTTLNDSSRNDSGYKLAPLSIGIEASILYY